MGHPDTDVTVRGNKTAVELENVPIVQAAGEDCGGGRCHKNSN